MGMECHGEPGAAVRSLPAWQTGEVSSVPQPGTVLEAADRNEMQILHSEVQECCRNRDCAGCERALTATSHPNPPGGERKRGLRVIKLLLFVEKDMREDAEWHKSSV